MMADRYFFTRGVHACWLDQTVIFLNVTDDRYDCLAGPAADVFAEIEAAGGTIGSASADKLARKLADRRLLTPDPATGRPIALTIPAEPAGSMMDRYEEPVVCWRRAPSLARALFSCRPFSASGGRSLADAIAAVRLWRRSLQTAKTRCTSNAPGLARQFLGLAPYFFTSEQACYLRSLMLLHYLAAHGVVGRWVFGVRLAPFGAHCWVSHGDILLNESTDIAAQYRPIMIV